jgi:hypothetical protein
MPETRCSEAAISASASWRILITFCRTRSSSELQAAGTVRFLAFGLSQPLDKPSQTSRWWHSTFPGLCSWNGCESVRERTGIAAKVNGWNKIVQNRRRGLLLLDCWLRCKSKASIDLTLLEAWISDLKSFDAVGCRDGLISGGESECRFFVKTAP